MIASRASKTFALSSLVTLGLLAGMTPAVGTETPTTTATAPAEVATASPPAAPAAPASEPADPVEEPAPSPAASPSQSSVAPEAPAALDYRNNSDLLADLIGEHGASMGQGIERLEVTGDAQKPAPGEDASPLSNGADSTDSVEGAAMAPLATNYWQPSSGVLGVDVSSHQGYVDWDGAWNYGSRWAYVKATEALVYKNPEFGHQYNGSGDRGMLRGAYHFAIPNVSSGAAQANYFVANGGGWSADGKTLPPLLDVEYNPYDELGNDCYNMSASQMVTWIRDFSNRMVTLTGRKPMIYTTTDWWNRCTGSSTAFSDHALHVASYNNYGAGTLPASWDFYSVWQYTDSGPVVGDWNQWNGSLTSLQAFARGGSAPTAVSPKPSVRSLADMVAVDSSGTLWNYPANGKGGFGARSQIGSGWASAKSINPADWNADGTIDLLAQWNNGTLSYYPGKPSGGFDSPVQIGSSGWQDISIAVGPWVKGQGITIVGARADGTLHYWPHTSTHRLGNAVRIGSGFTDMPIVMADQNLDGRMDLLSRDSNDNLLRYTGSGTGTIVSGSRTVVGNGWGVIDAINVVDGFNGTSSRGMIGRTTTGTLWYYPFTANGFASASTVGSGWSSYTIAGTDFTSTAPAPEPTPAPEPEPSPAPAPAQPSVRALADMVAIDSSGKLWNYPVNGKGGFDARFQIGSGWSAAASINPVDWNADGTIDLLAQWDNGVLNYYAGKPTGGFNSPVQIGTGWQGISIAVGPWVKGQGAAVVGARSDGALYYWPHTSTHRLGKAVKIGSGFTNMPIVMADQNLDGRMDLLSRDSSNNLLRYTGSGTGTIVSGSRTTVGRNWGGIDAVNAVDGFNGPTSRGMIGRNTAGYLTYYPFTTAGFGKARTVGSGWSSYTLAGTPFDR
ncbi:lysozyme [Arthrobacter sp. EH-1B-1]|uniref:Lysozyme n=1 Tax=Arthrobacter vasquezii TaxID=2977629 RepID=A0ABT6CWG0_9MICC|nr:lysozyme [Arthrobacter vasquezii]MDF9277364.1 lysozyme [Arthrobacter vasquezii]